MQESMSVLHYLYLSVLIVPGLQRSWPTSDLSESRKSRRSSPRASRTETCSVSQFALSTKTRTASASKAYVELVDPHLGGEKLCKVGQHAAQPRLHAVPDAESRWADLQGQGRPDPL